MRKRLLMAVVAGLLLGGGVVTGALPGAQAAVGSNSGTISLNDPTPVVEGNTGAGNIIVFTVSLAYGGLGCNPLAGDITVDFTTASDAREGAHPATSGAEATPSTPADYRSASGTITFSAATCETSHDIPVLVYGDNVNEWDETFDLTLSNPQGGATFAQVGDPAHDDSVGIGTIANDDAAPQLVVDDAAQLEGNQGVTNMPFVVHLNGATEVTQEVQYATTAGTATSPPDYFSTSGVLEFVPGDTSHTFNVPIVGNTTPEPNKYFNVSLQLNSGTATCTKCEAIGTIVNDDAGTPGPTPPPPASADNTFLSGATPAGLATIHFDAGPHPSMFPIACDWNGDGITTLGFFSQGTWILLGANADGASYSQLRYGDPGDLPVCGDWNGDGIQTIGVFRNGVFYLRNSNTSGVADLKVGYGNPNGDYPIVGDWNGDGVDTVGILRSGSWYLRNSNTTGIADVTFRYGDPGDFPVPGNWNGTGVDTPAIVRNGVWYVRNSNTGGNADVTFRYGNGPGDRPLAGRWAPSPDADTAGVYRNK